MRDITYTIHNNENLHNDEISIEDNFEISENAVNKQVKGLKSVVKLDENFHIYIHGDNQMIKRGYDNASGLYYYQLFFKEEK